MNLDFECGLAWSVLLSTTSTRHHRGKKFDKFTIIVNFTIIITKENLCQDLSDKFQRQRKCFF